MRASWKLLRRSERESPEPSYSRVMASASWSISIFWAERALSQSAANPACRETSLCRFSAISLSLRMSIRETIAETGVRVYTGGFERFVPEHGEPAYDVIVALDGVPRLAGTDTSRLAWSDAIAALRDRLVLDGRLLLGAANAFSMTRLLEPPHQLPADDKWGRDADATGEPPAGLEAIRARLAKVTSPFRSAERFNVEDIIDPRDTRPLLCGFAELAWRALGAD